MALELNGTTGVSLVQDGVITDANLPTGSVLQVVNGTTNTEASSTTSSYADTGLSASITPTSSSSKILVLVGQRLFCNNPAGNGGGYLKLMRDSTDLVLADRIGLSDDTGAMDVYFSTAYLDSPATTSSVTYKTRFGRNASSGTVFVQLSSARATITLMEIAG